VDVRRISRDEALDLILRRESHTWDHKSRRGGGATVEKIASCLANADGGEFALGIEPRNPPGGKPIDRWQGLDSIEEGNFVQQALVNLVSPTVPYSIEWLEIEGEQDRGLVALVGIYKSGVVHRTSKRDGRAASLRGRARAVVAATCTNVVSARREIAPLTSGIFLRPPEGSRRMT
jgi:ATP-dependent DNA helicase RecG